MLVQKEAPLIAILLLFLALGVAYNVAVPLFEAPDEMAHFRYLNWLADGQGLPDMVTDRQTVGHEVGQPPLYYVLLAPLVRGIARHDLEQVAPLNPYWRQGAGINVHYHTAAERFPYRQTALAVHVARFASTLIACATIISVYGLAQQIAPRQAALAAALVAFNPQFIFISSAINNDNLITALSTFVLLILVWQLGRPRLYWWHYALLGALWGLAMLAKMSGVALGGVILAGLILSAWRHHSWRHLIVGLPIVIAAAMAVSGWWFGRNWIRYGDPLAWDAILAANSGLLRPALLSWFEALHFATYLQRTYWAMFGYGIPAPPSFYWLINGMTLLGVAGLLLWFIRSGRYQLNAPKTLAVALLAVWSAVVFISLLQWMRLLVQTNQGRLFFPAIASVAILLALGLAGLRRLYPWPGVAMVTMLGAWAAATPFLIIGPAYAQPKPLAAGTAIANPVSTRFGDAVHLLGYELPQTTVKAGDRLTVTLYWEALAPILESYVVALHAVDSSGQPVAKLDTIPYRGRYATAVWQPGQPFRDVYTLPPFPDDAVPGQATLLLTLYPWGKPGQALPLHLNHSVPERSLALTNFKIAPPQSLEYEPAKRSGAIFGEQARLVGFDVVETAVPGQPLPITLYWEALSPDGNDYTVFVHLLDDSGGLVAQADGPPQANRYPTSIWAAGEQIQDGHTLALPDTTAAGRYSLTIGLYHPLTGQRLPAFHADGTQWPDNRVNLTSVEIIQSMEKD